MLSSLSLGIRLFAEYRVSSCSKICSILHLNFITRAGTPPTILYGGTSLHTTTPAAIIATHPIATPDNKVTLHSIYHGIRTITKL